MDKPNIFDHIQEELTILDYEIAGVIPATDREAQSYQFNTKAEASCATCEILGIIVYEDINDVQVSCQLQDNHYYVTVEVLPKDEA